MIEIETFSLRDGVDDHTFVMVDEDLQQRFAYQQPGLVRRTTARGEAGRWVVVTSWSSVDAADAARAAAAQSTAVAAWMALVNAGTVTLERYLPL
ncbi:MAG TPA: hypothetical protein VF855_15015 [Acidimicrobiales bacterium]